MDFNKIPLVIPSFEEIKTKFDKILVKATKAKNAGQAYRAIIDLNKLSNTCFSASLSVLSSEPTTEISATFSIISNLSGLIW